MPFLLLTTIMASLAVGSVNAQRSYLDEVLEPASKAKAAYYLDPGGKDGQGGFLAHIYTLDGVLKADGRYMDAEYRVADGHFVFYYPNGKVESEGDYQKGRKNGVWQRNDKWGRELAEKGLRRRTAEEPRIHLGPKRCHSIPVGTKPWCATSGTRSERPTGM
ncbi:MAG: hypothetical protein IPO60_09665 [Flavobacteriales bacterium]|nr:hypothetical protein [Flavobacteriales bacterium]